MWKSIRFVSCMILVAAAQTTQSWRNPCHCADVSSGSYEESLANAYVSESSIEGYPLPENTSSFDSGITPLAETIHSSRERLPSNGFGSGLASDDFPSARPPRLVEEDSLFENLSLMTGIEGSKQPQDFGVNAAIGGRVEANWGIPVYRPLGIGLQIGTATVASDNAVRVFELLSEDANRYQQYLTVGAFQRLDSTFAYGLVYDFLYQDSFDTTTLGQWRGRVSYRPWSAVELGSTINLRSFGDDAVFGPDEVRLRTIDQISIFTRRYFESGVQGSLWLGIADEHGESNAVTGPSPATDEAFLLGADVLAPLNANFAIYGETNLIMPSDTGTVDAFMAIAWYPWGNARRARRTAYAPLLPMAASTSFSVDLLPN